MKRLAELMKQGTQPENAAAMDLAEEHRQHIDRWYYPCDHPMHVALSGMYEVDPRFAAGFEKHGKGLAAFLVAAIRANADRR